MITGIFTDKYNVLESNMVWLPSPTSDLRLHFKFDNFEFDFQMQFIEDKEDKEQKLQRETDNSILKAICVNFNNAFGTGTTKPIEIATIEGKKLFIHFWSYLLGEDEKKQTRKVEYTVLIEG